MGLFKKKKDFLHIEVKQLVEWNEKAFEEKITVPRYGFQSGNGRKRLLFGHLFCRYNGG